MIERPWDVKIPTPSFYKILVIPISVQLKETYYYRLYAQQLQSATEVVEQFCQDFLSKLSDPIVGICTIFQNLSLYLNNGAIDELAELEGLSSKEIFSIAGDQISQIIEEIMETFKNQENELSCYDYLGIATGGIVLIHTEGIEDVDIISVLQTRYR